MLGVFVVARGRDEFVIYFRADWIRGRGYRIIRTWRGVAGDRSFKNLKSAWCFIRKFDFFGWVTVYPVGDAELRQFAGIASRDLNGLHRAHDGAGVMAFDKTEASKPDRPRE